MRLDACGVPTTAFASKLAPTGRASRPEYLIVPTLCGVTPPRTLSVPCGTGFSREEARVIAINFSGWQLTFSRLKPVLLTSKACRRCARHLPLSRNGQPPRNRRAHVLRRPLPAQIFDHSHALRGNAAPDALRPCGTGFSREEASPVDIN